MEYDLVRSNRKTVAIYIREGRIEVRAPQTMPKADIDRFVVSKMKWIADKLTKQSEQAVSRERFALGYGSLATLRGRQYPIEAREGSRAGYDGERFFMPPGLPPERIKSVCVQIYRMLAQKHMTDVARAFAQRMTVSPASVRITGARTRWGSCSGRKSINFSWRLIMAEDGVIDYVAVHELAHLIEMNHSARFWKIVADVLPDYQERRARLSNLQRKLGGEDW